MKKWEATKEKASVEPAEHRITIIKLVRCTASALLLSASVFGTFLMSSVNDTVTALIVLAANILFMMTGLAIMLREEGVI